MQIRILPDAFSVCRLKDFSGVDIEEEFVMLARTEEEHSLVCRTASVPKDTLAREDGWRAMRIEGILDFSLIGILAKIASLLAAEKISIFAVSTFNTDYLLIKEDKLEQAEKALTAGGYSIIH